MEQFKAYLQEALKNSAQQLVLKEGKQAYARIEDNNKNLSTPVLIQAAWIDQIMKTLNPPSENDLEKGILVQGQLDIPNIGSCPLLLKRKPERVLRVFFGEKGKILFSDYIKKDKESQAPKPSNPQAIPAPPGSGSNTVTPPIPNTAPKNPTPPPTPNTAGNSSAMNMFDSAPAEPATKREEQAVSISTPPSAAAEKIDLNSSNASDSNNMFSLANAETSTSKDESSAPKAEVKEDNSQMFSIPLDEPSKDQSKEQVSPHIEKSQTEKISFNIDESVSPAPETPVPETPVPETPVPETPVPETPVPETPVPETPVPETPVPELPVPEIPTPGKPVPEAPLPKTPAPDISVQENPAIDFLTPKPLTPDASATTQPVMQNTAPPQASKVTVPEIDSENKKLAFIFADDINFISQCKIYLESQKYQIQEVSDADTFSSLLERHNPKAVICDQNAAAFEAAFPSIYHLEVRKRLECFFIVIGPQMQTAQSKLEFSMSADLIVNSKDIGQLAKYAEKALLKKEKLIREWS